MGVVRRWLARLMPVLVVAGVLSVGPQVPAHPEEPSASSVALADLPDDLDEMINLSDLEALFAQQFPERFGGSTPG